MSAKTVSAPETPVRERRLANKVVLVTGAAWRHRAGRVPGIA